MVRPADSGIATDADRADWRAWLAADPLHGQAWQRMAVVAEQMASVPGALAAPTLSDTHQRSAAKCCAAPCC